MDVKSKKRRRSSDANTKSPKKLKSVEHLELTWKTDPVGGKFQKMLDFLKKNHCLAYTKLNDQQATSFNSSQTIFNNEQSEFQPRARNSNMNFVSELPEIPHYDILKI